MFSNATKIKTKNQKFEKIIKIKKKIKKQYITVINEFT